LPLTLEFCELLTADRCDGGVSWGTVSVAVEIIGVGVVVVVVVVVIVVVVGVVEVVIEVIGVVEVVIEVVAAVAAAGLVLCKNLANCSGVASRDLLLLSTPT